ncbi:hypothetical protein [Rheinheimera hassiensis]|uniref:hypothetical protein n=1 Tax=Rheinheimera hassiensis TaxID=1193627 RepID=UPI001F067644|nr:hypothetical protein [Rheinheimera hassiensis]
MSEALIIELVKAFGLVLASFVPSMTVLVVNRAKRSREKLTRDLSIALNDIRFLLAVEAEYGRVCKELTGESKARLIRKTVHAEQELNWSGAFSDKKAASKILVLKGCAPNSFLR